jgi:hypothetical protein
MRRSIAAALGAALAFVVTRAEAHHEALFGPQSSLAVESPAFVSFQSHVHATGRGASYVTETTYLTSAGFAPIAGVPWAISVVQPFTFQYANQPAGDQIGPNTSCGGCFRRENVLVGASYRFDFTGLQRDLGKDGNFALVSASLEPPTGAKDYRAFHGPVNGIIAAMAGVEWKSLSAVALGYFRRNSRDGDGAKKGDNALVGVGVAFTPVDEDDRMFSLQLGFGAEIHARDVASGSTVDDTGGIIWLLSPTVVWSPIHGMRLFTLVSLPIAQRPRNESLEDRFRCGLGLIYAFGH